MNVLDLDWRPVVSKLLPSMQVNSHLLHSDHWVMWQSPGESHGAGQGTHCESRH